MNLLSVMYTMVIFRGDLVYPSWFLHLFGSILIFLCINLRFLYLFLGEFNDTTLSAAERDGLTKVLAYLLMIDRFVHFLMLDIVYYTMHCALSNLTIF